MDACTKTPNRTAPAGGGEENGAGRQGPSCSRINGWSWPPHPFQMLAWLLYTYFTVVGLGVLVPLLPAHWTPAGYICTGVTLACHLCTHVMAVSVDPADHNVRARGLRGPLPVLDRSKHAHAIENCHCYLCQVDVGPKSKHCSACNKCVADFDHHCRWLNNCVGSRNYKLFLYSVASAVAGVCVLLALSASVLTEFFSEPSEHLRAPNRTWPEVPLLLVPAAVPALAAVTGALALLACVLLCHLLLFHFYLMWNRLSTYEYIVRQRHRQDGRQGASPVRLKSNVHPPGVHKIAEHSAMPGHTQPLPDLSVANGGARDMASPVVEAPPTISTPHKLADHTCAQKITKKKMGRPGAMGTDAGHPVERVGAWLPGAPSSGPRLLLVRAAAPPAEYHSDSAESLEELPVALDKLASRAPRRSAVWVCGKAVAETWGQAGTSSSSLVGWRR